MRIVTIAALLLTLPPLARAQTPRPADSPPAPSTLPPIGLPLPQIGLPLPPLGLDPGPTSTTTPKPAAPARPPQRGQGPHRGRTAPPAVIYVVPSYGWSVHESAPTPGVTVPAAPAPTVASERPAAGTLRLELQPRPTGQLYVDGAYVGTLDDLGTDLTLQAGTRRLEIRQPGYRPFELAVRIEDGRALTYKGTLDPQPPASAPPRVPATAATAPPATPAAAPIPRKPFYYIPGCYLGDVPPRDAGLPPTCDVSRAVIFKP